MADHYEILGIDIAASQEEVRAAYRRVARTSHPDVGGSAALFRLVQHAHETLGNLETRAAYDEASGVTARRALLRETFVSKDLQRCRELYEAMADRCNRAIDEAWGFDSDHGHDWTSYPGIYAKCAIADAEFARAIAAEAWPASVRAAAESHEWTFLRDLWNQHSRRASPGALRAAILDALRPANSDELAKLER